MHKFNAQWKNLCSFSYTKVDVSTCEWALWLCMFCISLYFWTANTKLEIGGCKCERPTWTRFCSNSSSLSSAFSSFLFIWKGCCGFGAAHTTWRLRTRCRGYLKDDDWHFMRKILKFIQRQVCCHLLGELVSPYPNVSLKINLSQTFTGPLKTCMPFSKYLEWCSWFWPGQVGLPTSGHARKMIGRKIVQF